MTIRQALIAAGVPRRKATHVAAAIRANPRTSHLSDADLEARLRALSDADPDAVRLYVAGHL